MQIEHPLKQEERAPALMGTKGAAKVWHLSSSDDPAEDYQLLTLQWKDLSLHSPQGRKKGNSQMQVMVLVMVFHTVRRGKERMTRKLIH